MGAGSVLKLGLASGSDGKVITLGYGGSVVVEPPESDGFEVRPPVLAGAPYRIHTPKIIHGTVHVTGNGRVMLWGGKAREEESLQTMAVWLTLMN